MPAIAEPLADVAAHGSIAAARIADMLRTVDYASLSPVDGRISLDAEGIVALCREHGIGLLTERDAAYPRMLREIPDPPGVLFVRGEPKPQDDLAIAIVGTRRPTGYGINVAERLAEDLASRGLAVTSGLARGVDSAAHRGASRSSTARWRQRSASSWSGSRSARSAAGTS